MDGNPGAPEQVLGIPVDAVLAARPTQADRSSRLPIIESP